MKNKVIVSFLIFMLLLLSVVFASSYVQALSKEEKLQAKQEILEQEVKNNNLTKEEVIEIYQNREERIIDCNNNCDLNENCPLYQQNGNCMTRNNACLQENCNGRRNCGYQQGCTRNMCKR